MKNKEKEIPAIEVSLEVAGKKISFTMVSEADYIEIQKQMMLEKMDKTELLMLSRLIMTDPLSQRILGFKNPVNIDFRDPIDELLNPYPYFMPKNKEVPVVHYNKNKNDNSNEEE